MISSLKLAGKKHLIWWPSLRTERWLLSRNCPVNNQTSPVPLPKIWGPDLEMLSLEIGLELTGICFSLLKSCCFMGLCEGKGVLGGVDSCGTLPVTSTEKCKIKMKNQISSVAGTEEVMETHSWKWRSGAQARACPSVLYYGVGPMQR